MVEYKFFRYNNSSEHAKQVIISVDVIYQLQIAGEYNITRLSRFIT